MRLLFDKADLDILREIRLLERESDKSSTLPAVSYSSHAEGIIEIAAGVEMRIAAAVYFLLNSTTTDEYPRRLRTLQRLYHDVDTLDKGLRLNAARVQVEIMKSIFDCQGSVRRRLELIRDFREVRTGKPRIVRGQLRHYQLLEVPEDFSQLSFDDSVENSSRLGNKNPSHLILDAWIKGIRKLQVISRNYIDVQEAHELLTAGEILGVEIDIGIELPVFYCGRFISLVWTPLGMNSPSAFVRLIKSSALEGILEASRKVDIYHQEQIFRLLRLFSERVERGEIQGVPVAHSLLTVQRYKEFLGESRPNEVNLSEFIFSSISAGSDLIPEIILMRYLRPLRNEISFDDDAALRDGSLAADVKNLVKLIVSVPVTSRITLLTGNLRSWEVPDILYQGKGHIDAVEIFNLRDYTLAREGLIKYGRAEINRFRKSVNDRDISSIKLLLGAEIERVQRKDVENKDYALEALQKVRRNIGKLLDRYSAVHIEPAIGSAAAGRGKVFYGMGLVVSETLGRRAARDLIHSSAPEHLALPLGCQVFKRVEYLSGGSGIINYWSRLRAWRQRRRKWVRHTVSGLAGEEIDSNVYTLTGRFGEQVGQRTLGFPGYWWEYLNTDIKNIIKILLGFIPAFLTFYLTADWDVLKYGGGFIWMAITGGRNALQSLLAAGGFDRNLNISWGSLVDKKRIAESLMYTGLSVPLLEYLVRELLLHRLIGINAAGSPLVVYAVISGVNGCYIALHNYIRGFPLAAIIGNLFRSVLAVPVSLVISAALVWGLGIWGVAGAGLTISAWSAVISKAASDIVACLIEGLADRAAFLKLRRREIKELEIKFLHLSERFELLDPSRSLLEIFEDMARMVDICKEKQSTAIEELVLLALDLLYFWNNKTRAKMVIKTGISRVSSEERQLLKVALNILSENTVCMQALSDFGNSSGAHRAQQYYLQRWQVFVRDFVTALKV